MPGRAVITMRPTAIKEKLMFARSEPRAARGQVLVIVALGIVVVLAMVGLVIDGGYAWGRQRDTQNGADSLAKTGTTVIQHYLAGVDASTPTDWSVACAMDAAAQKNGVVLQQAEYTDYRGQPLVPSVLVGQCGAVDPGTPIPAGAQGVMARTSETFDTFIAQIIGFSTLTTIADATAVVGVPTAVPGGALPVTFPQKGTVCDSLMTAFEIKRDDGDGTWEPYEIIDEASANASNEAIIPLCDVAPGSVGWLDYGCGQTLAGSIADPCHVFIPIPAWIHTQTGNVNSLEDELNAYAGSQVGVAETTDSVLAVPIHDFTCSDPQANSAPITSCASYPTWSGNGDNLYYHVPLWVGFKIDAAYTQGGDVECKQAPGSPQLVNPQPPGKVGCLKGWFVNEYNEPGPIGLALINPGDNLPMQVALIE
jgi:hypothetical protein